MVVNLHLIMSLTSELFLGQVSKLTTCESRYRVDRYSCYLLWLQTGFLTTPSLIIICIQRDESLICDSRIVGLKTHQDVHVLPSTKQIFALKV